MGKMAAALIEAVDKERIKRQLSHRQFSFLLGIDPTYWHMIRHGERPLNLNLLSIFMKKLPEITPEVTIYIMRQGNDGDFPKTPKKIGGKNIEAYKDVCPPPKTPKYPSKIAK